MIMVSSEILNPSLSPLYFSLRSCIPKCFTLEQHRPEIILPLEETSKKKKIQGNIFYVCNYFTCRSQDLYCLLHMGNCHGYSTGFSALKQCKMSLKPRPKPSSFKCLCPMCIKPVHSQGKTASFKEPLDAKAGMRGY